MLEVKVISGLSPPASGLSIGKNNQRTNGPVNAHLISGPTISTIILCHFRSQAAIVLKNQRFSLFPIEKP